EARPAGAAVEFGLGAVERKIAGGAVEPAGAMLVVERARERAFRAVLAQDLELRRGEQTAPLVLAVRDFERLRVGFARVQQGRHGHRGRHAGAADENFASIHVGLLACSKLTSSACPTIARAAGRARNCSGRTYTAPGASCSNADDSPPPARRPWRQRSGCRSACRSGPISPMPPWRPRRR